MEQELNVRVENEKDCLQDASKSSISCIMTNDIDFLANYKPNQLYINPGDKGAYATIVDESNEQVIGEIEVTPRCRIGLSAFYVRDKGGFSTLKIYKLQYHQSRGWRPDGHICINKFQLTKMMDFWAIISSLNLSDAKKTRISLNDVDFSGLHAILGSTKGSDFLKELANAPELHEDIFAVAAKREALAEFERNLQGVVSEPEWQSYFERNAWVFGLGLNYVFLDQVGVKLEARTTGNAFDRPGKIVDALMKTRAEVSQYVLVEIKKNSTALLQPTPYRSGCWGVSTEVSNAVTQIQKTPFDFGQNRFRDSLKDKQGNDTGAKVYAVEPRCYLVIGNLSQLQENDDQVACFELYRKNIRSPEIITYDELFCRATCIVENITVDKTSGRSRSLR